ncbi:uncharacterized protein EI97DRAFT_388184 [Westerdykella ornata]|uniref:Uncharacterized protein n=1 Tax=Westerdykella ornata TaxID=318751 RepID=A0A6A6J4J0_WESOR|nr:uncharacterized protein EI97DRAFT_388184 [Westerdykella ornata]KAF2271312.1 hypothetical protein EI97DRAFT_388184 [Westerdykella ornata]
MANFAPYQDTPETQRALSPPPAGSSRVTSPRASLDRTRNIGTAAVSSPRISTGRQHDRWAVQEPERTAWNAMPAFGGVREDLDMFETRLGIRMDYEACLAYLLLPPAGGALLLVLEHRSDFVRFHAWQSSLLFSFIFVLHIIFSFSSILSWLLFVCDIALIGFLTMHAYQDAGTLDRYEVPFFGPLASSILDDE